MSTSANEIAEAQSSRMNPRSKAPVFVLGCPRSGTTVLYHMLLSAGGFAVYRAESNVFNLLVPRFGDLSSARNRHKLMEFWVRSKLFRVSGLDASEITAKIMAECRSGGDFLRIVMEEIARKQGVGRWADCTPDHLLYIPEIKRELPDALIIHIIRDGRDVALSYVKQGWAYPLPWDRDGHLAVAGLYWEWIVRNGRECGRKFGADYHEVYFEDLVTKPQQTLSKLSDFIGQELDFERIQKTGIGSVSEPNSSFLDESGDVEFNPVGRWKDKLSPQQLATFEGMVGDFLQNLGYPLAGEEQKPNNGFRIKRMKAIYPFMFEAKQWLKNRNLLGRHLINIDRMEIQKS